MQKADKLHSFCSLHQQLQQGQQCYALGSWWSGCSEGAAADGGQNRTKGRHLQFLLYTRLCHWHINAMRSCVSWEAQLSSAPKAQPA
jgi:hypothetical protein